jgi:hypothetical protein
MAPTSKLLRLLLVPKFSLSSENFGEGDAYAMGNTLLEYFTPAIKSTKYTSVDFWFDAAANTVTSDDLVCYLVARQFKSIIQQRIPGSSLGPGGSTQWSTVDNAMISEIYFDATSGDSDRPTLLANMVFHEWLHNRLDAGMLVHQDVHATGHGMLTTGGPISSGMAANTADIVSMRRGLHHPIAQYASW